MDAILLLGRRIIISTSSHACPAFLSRACGGVNGGAAPSRQSASCRILFALFSFCFPEGAPRAVSLRHSSGSLALLNWRRRAKLLVCRVCCLLVPDRPGQAENSFDAEPTRPPAPETLCAPSSYALFVVSMPVADDCRQAQPSRSLAPGRCTMLDPPCCSQGP